MTEEIRDDQKVDVIKYDLFNPLTENKWKKDIEHLEPMKDSETIIELDHKHMVFYDAGLKVNKGEKWKRRRKVIYNSIIPL